MESIWHEAMVAHQYLEKRRKMAMPKGELWTYREIRERGVIDAVGSNFTTIPKRATVDSDSHPTVEVIGDAGPDASRIRFQTAAHRQQSQRDPAVNIGPGMKERISAEKLPSGRSLILRRRNGAQAAKESNRRQRYYCDQTA